MTIHTSRILLIACAGAYALLVAFNNLTDYGSNYAFVEHVLAMDTTFPGNSGMWRAINSPALYHVAYWIIILAEMLVAWFCLAGCWQMWRGRQDTAAVAQGRSTATKGLTLGILLWFGGFIVIGGEWFLMWQSSTWNGIQPAFQTAAMFAIILGVLNMESAR